MSKTTQDKFIEDLTQFFNKPVCQKGTGPLKTGVEISVYLDEMGPVTLRKEKQGATIVPEPPDSPDMTIRVTQSGLDHLLANSSTDVGELGVEILKLMASSDDTHRMTAKVHINGFKILRNGYLGILPLGGSTVVKFLASKGFTGIGKIKSAIDSLRG